MPGVRLTEWLAHELPDTGHLWAMKREAVNLSKIVCHVESFSDALWRPPIPMRAHVRKIARGCLGLEVLDHGLGALGVRK